MRPHGNSRSGNETLVLHSRGAAHMVRARRGALMLKPGETFEFPTNGISGEVDDEQQREKQEADKPRLAFIYAARQACFSKVQAEFLWEHFAKDDPSHWSLVRD
jgi:hypothetical protein